MKRLISYICGAAILLIIGFILFPLFANISGSRAPSCFSNLKQIALAMQLYSADYEGHFPPDVIVGKTVGWGQAVQPYLHTYFVFQCPQEKNKGQENPRLPGFTDYWMNSNLSGLEAKNIAFPAEIIMLGDGDGGASDSTASYAISRLSDLWKHSSDLPTKRHHSGANYAFLDGSVKWLKPEQIAQVPPLEKSQFHTFLVK